MIVTPEPSATLQELDKEREKQGSTWKPVDLRAILAGDLEGDRPAVLEREDGEFLLYPGRINTVYGEPEGFKTWVALMACAQESLAGQTVVYIDYEDSPRAIVERLCALNVPDDVIAERFIYIQPTERVECVFRPILITESGGS